MSKANHTITVPREYLEELEKFKKENTTNKNSVLSVKNLGGFSYGIFVEIDESISRSIVTDVETLLVVNNKGMELSRFRKVF